MNKHSPIVPDEPAWPALPEVPNGMAVKKRRDEALAAAVDAEDRLEAAEIAFDQAGRADSDYEVQASSLSPEEWTAEAREFRAARVETERFLSLARMRREEAWQDFVAADIALEQQSSHAVYRRYDELVVDVAKLAEALEAKTAALNAAIPLNDRTLRGTHQNQMFRLFHSMLFRATDHAFSSVREIEAREFATSMIAVPDDKAFRAIAGQVEKGLEVHWLNCRKMNPDGYRIQRGRRKLGGRGGIKKGGDAIEEASP